VYWETYLSSQTKFFFVGRRGLDDFIDWIYKIVLIKNYDHDDISEINKFTIKILINRQWERSQRGGLGTQNI